METDPTQPEPEVARPVESSKESHNITANSPTESDSNSNPTTLMTKPTEPEVHTEAVENTTQPLSPVAAKTINNMETPKEEIPAPTVVPLTTPATTYPSPAPPIHSSVPTPTNIPQPTTTAVIATSQSQSVSPLVQTVYSSDSITPVPNATPPHHPIPQTTTHQTTHHNMPPHIVPHQGKFHFFHRIVNETSNGKFFFLCFAGMAGLPGHPAYGAFPGAGPGPQRSPYYAPQYANHPSQPYHQYPPYPYHQQYGPQPSHYVGSNNAPPMDAPPYGPPPPGPIPSGPPIHPPSDGDETKRKFCQF